MANKPNTLAVAGAKLEVLEAEAKLTAAKVELIKAKAKLAEAREAAMLTGAKHQVGRPQ
jgi:outer membrane protein TolC